MDGVERIRWLPPFAPLESLDGVENVGFRDELQELTRRVATSAHAWTNDERQKVTEIFDVRASDWGSRSKPTYFLPLIDALDRGGVPSRGTCIEIGSGTGLQSPTLLGHFDEVISLDLSFEMIARSPRNGVRLLLTDASQLPFRSECAKAIVCVNAFLFAKEYDRVLEKAGFLVFVSTRGEKTPIYLSPEAVLEAMSSATKRDFVATCGRAGEGIWSVVTEAPT